MINYIFIYIYIESFFPMYVFHNKKKTTMNVIFFEIFLTNSCIGFLFILFFCSIFLIFQFDSNTNFNVKLFRDV